MSTEPWLTSTELLSDWIGADQPGDSEETIQRWIGRAERLLRREFPDLPARLESGSESDLADTIKDVLSAMVTRVLRNPQGIRQQQQSAGAYSSSITFGGDIPGALFLTDSEKDALRPPGTAGNGKAFNIQVSSPVGRSGHLPWCTFMFGKNKCSCGYLLAGRPIYEEA